MLGEVAFHVVLLEGTQEVCVGVAYVSGVRGAYSRQHGFRRHQPNMASVAMERDSLRNGHPQKRVSCG